MPNKLCSQDYKPYLWSINHIGSFIHHSTIENWSADSRTSFSDMETLGSGRSESTMLYNVSENSSSLDSSGGGES